MLSDDTGQGWFLQISYKMALLLLHFGSGKSGAEIASTNES